MIWFDEKKKWEASPQMIIFLIKKDKYKRGDRREQNNSREL